MKRGVICLLVVFLLLTSFNVSAGNFLENDNLITGNSFFSKIGDWFDKLLGRGAVGYTQEEEGLEWMSYCNADACFDPGCPGYSTERCETDDDKIGDYCYQNPDDPNCNDYIEERPSVPLEVGDV